MDKYEFLKKWQAYSGLRLIGVEREQFLKECELLLYLDDDVLEIALKVASQKNNFDLQYIETVGLHLRHYLRRVQYEVINGEGKAPNRKPRKRACLTLISNNVSG